ncbi:MAG: primary-amine oxidase [Tildeniella torsiva UHER 1998/13D]|nr:primary-amine oxidase [Tildeniella torsiva UHER 1998/13D]
MKSFPRGWRAKGLRYVWVSAIALVLIATLTLRPAPAQSPPHPLDPLTADEIQTAVAVVKAAHPLSEEARFPNISLQEPDKTLVWAFQPGDAVPRAAFVVVLEPVKNITYEAVVDLTTAELTAWDEISGVQPAILDEDFEVLSELAKADPRWQAAMTNRGITDFESAVVDGWAPGMLSPAERASGKRLMRGYTYYQPNYVNYYGAPIEGLMVVVNLTDREVMDVVDTGAQPFSKANFDYDEETTAPLQPSPKALTIQQPDGKTFGLDGNTVTWQNWKFRYILHPREGLTLYQVTYAKDEVERPILYRAGLSEMVVPYAETGPTWAVKSAFDVGEYRFGWLSTTMYLGNEVPQNAVLLDALMADDLGEPTVLEDVIALYERDGGILWRHYDFNSDTHEGRRSRELVMTTVAAIGNYDYAISWIFHEDGTLEEQTDLTGIMLVKATEDVTETHDHLGHLVAPNVVAVNHQHFLNFRLDFDVDGPTNSVAEMNVATVPQGNSNPYGNAFAMETTPLASEAKAVRDMSMANSRTWMVMGGKENELGMPAAYMLMPGSNSAFFPAAESNVRQRGEFAGHHLWVTQYKPSELYAAGDYPNQSLPSQGLPEWVADDEPLAGEDVVLWYTQGVTHIPRPEEWPIMTVHKTGFKIMSHGFFPQNPVLNVAAPEPVLTAETP